MLSPEQKEKILEMKNQGLSINLISKKMKISQPTIRKYLKEISQKQPEPKQESTPETAEMIPTPEEKEETSIKDIERATRTAIAGQKEGKAVAEEYMQFKDELDEEMTRKLLYLRFKYDDYLKRHNIKFGDFVEDALEKKVIYEASLAPKVNLKEFLNGIVIVKALERL
ncbi:MAG: hypothetical protein QXU98_05850 [Candidatus Parvarchaeota archaeon]